MAKDKFDTFFEEYLDYHRCWNIVEWREFANRFMLSGFIHINETKEITKTKEGYKLFFESIFLNIDKIKKLQSITEEELLQTSRINIHLSESIKSKRRQLLEFIFAISAGIISYFYLNWKWLFVIVGTYAFIKASFLFSILGRLDARNLMSKQELAKVERQDTIARQKTIDGYKGGYAISQGCFQFILSLLILGGFATLARLLTSLIF